MFNSQNRFIVFQAFKNRCQTAFEIKKRDALKGVQSEQSEKLNCSLTNQQKNQNFSNIHLSGCINVKQNKIPSSVLLLVSQR